MTFHTNGESLVWSALAHEELGYCFTDVGTDRDNKVVIMTGAGDDCCADINAGSFKLSTAGDWDLTFFDGRRLLNNLLDVGIPRSSVRSTVPHGFTRKFRCCPISSLPPKPHCSRMHPTSCRASSLAMAHMSSGHIFSGRMGPLLSSDRSGARCTESARLWRCQRDYPCRQSAGTRQGNCRYHCGQTHTDQSV